MEFFKRTTHIDFLGIRKWTALASVVVMLGSLVILAMNGLNWGLDFTGGTQIQITYEQPANLPQMRDSLAKGGFDDALVQAYGDASTALIRMSGHNGKEAKHKSISQQVLKVLPGARLLSVDYIGPQVGHELATNGALALVIALLSTMVYIALRFEWRFAVSAAVALVHDPILILGVFAYFHIEFDLIALAAILTVIGYSLNDTVVVFDRVRENFRKLRKATPTEVVNLSVNETLSRTIITSMLTLFAVLALFFLGGEKVHGFSIALIIGIAIGTYSSIYVAGALAVALGLNRADLMLPPKKEIDDSP